MSTKLRIWIKKLVDPELDLKLDYGELIRVSILILYLYILYYVKIRRSKRCP